MISPNDFFVWFKNAPLVEREFFYFNIWWTLSFFIYLRFEIFAPTTNLLKHQIFFWYKNRIAGHEWVLLTRRRPLQVHKPTIFESLFFWKRASHSRWWLYVHRYVKLYTYILLPVWCVAASITVTSMDFFAPRSWSM